VVTQKKAFTEVKEKNFIQEVFWDAKAQTYSASRVVMVLGALISAMVMAIVLWIVVDSYRNGQPIPDLSWLAYGGGGSALGGAFGYAANRWGSADQEYPEATPKAEL
jgi:hypothetical protein